MKRVYVVSPLAPRAGFTLEENRAFAQALCRRALLEGVAAWAPHVFYPALLDDSSEKEHSLGLAAGRAWLEAADEVWVYDGIGISNGMHAELSDASRLGKTVLVREDWARIQRQRV